MNANYSEALEQQVALLKWSKSSEGRGYLSDTWGPQLPSWVVPSMLNASTFYVAPVITGAVDTAARTLPEVVLNEAMVPSNDGFCWFGRPIGGMFRRGYGDPFNQAVLNAITWVTSPEKSGGRVVGVTPWMTFGDRILPVTWVYWRLGETQDAAVAILPHEDDDESILLRREAHALLDRTAALWMFLQQRILVATPQLAERHARKRLMREGFTSEPLIRVVELRRREHVGDPRRVEPVERDWSCQWIVRGHWRQQFYPTKHGTQPIWITPYVKGPDDKPLKPPRATVFAVVR